MRNEQTLVMDRQGTHASVEESVNSGIKTILFQVIDDEFHSQRLDAALDLARACSAHLSFLHVTPVEAYVALDTFGGVFVMNDILRALDERDVELQTKIEERLAKEDVSWDYEQVAGHVDSMVISRAALADLLITARNPVTQDFIGPTVGFLGDLLNRSRTPLFIFASPEGNFDPTGTALIAWNGSFEAANAVRSSVGLLRMASEVRVLQVLEKKPGAKQFPATKLLEYLSRQGVHAELATEPSPTGDLGHDMIAAMIVEQARGAGAAYIVMGGYSHTRIGEYVFGGVTRTLLNDCSFPLVIAH